MRGGSEIFRVYLGSVASYRDPDLEHRRIVQITASLNKLAGGFSKESRLQFSLDVCKETLRQWLVVSATPALQRQLFSSQPGTASRPNAAGDTFCETATAQMRIALSNLNALTNLARVSPAQFHELVAKSEASPLEGLVRVEPIEIQTPCGQTLSADRLTMARRTPMPDAVYIDFLIELCGHGKALVRLPKHHRRRHRVKETRLMLYWSPLSHPSLLQTMREAQDHLKPVHARVWLLVDRMGYTKALEFNAEAAIDCP